MMTQKELDEMLSSILEEHRAGVRAAFEAGRRAGAAEEREACAKLADDAMSPSGSGEGHAYAVSIARSIRARAT